MLIRFSQADGFVASSFKEMGLPEWGEGQSEEQWLSECGFELVEVDGDRQSDADKATWYLRKNGQCLYAVDCAVRWDMIVVADEAEMMALRTRMAPLLMLRSLAEEMAFLFETMRRLFRAIHGHDAGDVCDECDPWEMAHRARIAATRKSKT